MNKRPLIIITDRDGRENLLLEILAQNAQSIYAIVLRSVVDVKSASEKLLETCIKQGVLLLAHSNTENIKYCDGIHLNKKSKSIKAVRDIYGAGLIIGYSSHSIDEAKHALKAGANYVFLSPVFKSKDNITEPMGIEVFNKAVEEIGDGVFALGGVNTSNYQLITDKAAGFACMSCIFQSKTSVEDFKLGS